MMGPRSQCYIQSHKVIGPLVLEKKIVAGILLYMDVAAILVMWSRPREQTFVPLSHGGFIWNLALIDPVVLEKKIFENGGRTTEYGQRTDNGRTKDHGYTVSSPVSLKAQVSLKASVPTTFFIYTYHSKDLKQNTNLHIPHTYRISKWRIML